MQITWHGVIGVVIVMDGSRSIECSCLIPIVCDTVCVFVHVCVHESLLMYII